MQIRCHEVQVLGGALKFTETRRKETQPDAGLPTKTYCNRRRKILKKIDYIESKEVKTLKSAIYLAKLQILMQCGFLSESGLRNYKIGYMDASEDIKRGKTPEQVSKELALWFLSMKDLSHKQHFPIGHFEIQWSLAGYDFFQSLFSES